jgi:ParB family chromosome partitioning protein
MSGPVVDPKKRALGRGLDALLPPAPAAAAGNYGDKNVFLCALEKIVPHKGQPRQHFDATALEELAQSIREHGLLEPIVVRRAAPGADKFEIIAGERRWRACQKAGLREALVVVKDVSTAHAFELALIENVQREDLNPVELAEALDRLVKEHGFTQESLATRLGKDRTTITNSLRLLKLPARVRGKIVTGELTEGHARALLGAAEDGAIEQLADKVIAGRLSVRATEALVRQARDKKDKGKNGAAGGGAPGGQKSAAIKDLEQRLTRALGTKVEVRDQGNRGEVAIPYADLDALDRVIDKLLR